MPQPKKRVIVCCNSRRSYCNTSLVHLGFAAGYKLYLRYDQSVCPVGIASSSTQDLDFRRKLDNLRASDSRSLMQFIHKVCFDQQRLSWLSLYVLWVTGFHVYARGGEPCSTARGPDPLKKLHAVITTTLRLHVPM